MEKQNALPHIEPDHLPPDLQKRDFTYQRLEEAKKNRRWVYILIIGICIFLGFQLHQDLKALTNPYRTHDTIIDGVVKHQMLKMVQKHVPKEAEPNATHVITETSLGQLQQAANDEHKMTKLLQQHDVKQQDIQTFQQTWFKPKNHNLRNQIYHGNFVNAYPMINYYWLNQK